MSNERCEWKSSVMVKGIVIDTASVQWWEKDGAWHVALQDPDRGGDLFWTDRWFHTKEEAIAYVKGTQQEKKMSYTKNERAVFNDLVDISMGGSVGGVEDAVRASGLSPKQVRGVIASLVKKGKVFAEETCVHERAGDVDLWACHPEHGPVFWCDYLTEEEAEEQKIKDADVK